MAGAHTGDWTRHQGKDVNKQINFTVDPLPDGKYEGATVIKGATPAGRLFVKLPDGRIYVAGNGRRSVRLDSQFGCNDADRRAFAKLAGITVSSIKAKMKENERLAAIAAAKGALESLRRRSAAAGYKLVKVAP